MLEVQVKNIFWSKLYGRSEIKEFANSINDETIILYSLKSEDFILVSQKGFEDVQIRKAFLSELKDLISRDMLADTLKREGFPEKYTLVKAEKDKNYIFVSEKYRDAYDIILFKDNNKFDWDITAKKYSKEKYESINLGGKSQE
jgi:hypothetical protein